MILAIETSVPEASVTLVEDGAVVFSEDFTNGRKHNSQIFDSLEKVAALLQGELQGEKLDGIIVGTGPGSYSGVRVGIAAAQGIAIVHGCPAIGLGSLAATKLVREAVSSFVIGDARRGLYFISETLANGEAGEAELMEAAEFHQRLQKSVSDGVKLFTMDDPASLGLSDELQVLVTQTRPEAELLIDIWQGLGSRRQEVLSQIPLSPSYLRPPFTSKAKGGHPLISKD